MLPHQGIQVKTNRTRNISLLLVLLLVTGCNPAPQVIQAYPHNASIFTQGMEFGANSLLQSSGLYGKSFVSISTLEGNNLRTKRLPDKYFAEGLTKHLTNYYVLTWREETLFIFNQDLTINQTKQYHGEGWGLANNESHFLMSNGSVQIQVREAPSFELVSSHTVTRDGEPIERLNELEYTPYGLYANVWQTDEIVLINTSTWNVTHTLDLEGLLSVEERHDAGVLNGVAYREPTDTLFVTGKNWPKMFEIEPLPE